MVLTHMMVLFSYDGVNSSYGVYTIYIWISVVIISLTTLSHYPDNRETGYSNVLPIKLTRSSRYFFDIS